MLSRREFHRYLLSTLGACLLPGSVRAALTEGADWRAISPPQPSDVPGKIEVLEFFSYGCPHCARVNPLVKEWSAKLPDDVAFRRVPVTFGRAAWENLARLYYALELTGDLERLDQEVFSAVIEEHAGLHQQAAMRDWLAKRNVDMDNFAKVFDGFTVNTRVGRATALTEHYKIDGVPTITVGGRYVVLSSGMKSYEDLFAIADQLIDKVRAEDTA